MKLNEFASDHPQQLYPECVAVAHPRLMQSFGRFPITSVQTGASFLSPIRVAQFHSHCPIIAHEIAPF